MEETVTQKELEYAQLRTEYQTMRRKADIDKDALKRSNK